MGFFEFIIHCLKCMILMFPAALGSVPEGYSWKDAIAGIITFIVIIALVFLILYIFGFRFGIKK